jgi:NYN domain
MRVYVYVDGLNLYYRALKRTPFRWLNIQKLAQELLDPADTINLVHYFTAPVSARSGDKGAPERQTAYLSALRTLPNLKIHLSRFLPKTKWRPIANPNWDRPVFVEIHDTEEKGSDVSLAVHLLNDGWHRRYETALVMSQDTDLAEAVRIVVAELGIPVGLVWLDGREPGGRLVKAASFVRQLTHARLTAAQFPPQLMGRRGRLLHKPSSW